MTRPISDLVDVSGVFDVLPYRPRPAVVLPMAPPLPVPLSPIRYSDTYGHLWDCSACGAWQADYADAEHALIGLKVHQHDKCTARRDGGDAR